MSRTNKQLLMWVLYALLALAVCLLQTVVLSNVRFRLFPVHLMPALVVACAMFTGHELGGLFGLIMGFVWSSAGSGDGALSILTFTVCAVLAGWLCDAVFPRTLPVYLILSAGALLLHQMAVFLLSVYLSSAAVPWSHLPLDLFLSVCGGLPLFAASAAIRKAGGD